MPPFRRHDGARPLRHRRRGLTLRFGAKRVRSHRDRTLFTRRSVRGIFRHVQEVNCPKGARETTLGCAAAKNDLTSFRRGRRKPGRRPLPGLSPGDEGRKSPVNCLLLSGYLRSGSPRSGLAGERAAAAARRKPPVGCLLLPVPPAIRLAAERLRRRGMAGDKTADRRGGPPFVQSPGVSSG